jgi:hypothetical protein
MFTGDLEKAGFAALIKNNAAFRQALSETHVYVAAHHGRENGCSEELLPYLTNVYYAVISDKGYMYDTQRTIPFYQKIAKGGPFRGSTRKVLTTRNDGRIGFRFNANSWGPYEKQPKPTPLDANTLAILGNLAPKSPPYPHLFSLADLGAKPTPSNSLDASTLTILADILKRNR